MKKYLYSILTLLFFSCNNNDTGNKERPLPAPPDTSIKYVIHYNGKTITLKTDSERKKLFDSLNIKDTIIGRLE